MEVTEEPKALKPVPVAVSQLRLQRAVRNQMEMMLRDLDSLVPEDHPVRAIWAFISGLDISEFYSKIKAAVDRPGRPPIDPQILLTLWVYATVEGIGSARRLDTLCKEHDAYKWICGGVPVDYHVLSDFRVSHQEGLDHLLTSIVACLMHKELVTLKSVAQDGVKVRAGAGAASFHRRSGLEKCLVEAEAQVKKLADERDKPDPEITNRQRAARERAARERLERVKAALNEFPTVQGTKQRQARTLNKNLRPKITEARVSTTDRCARVMKMPDGGFRPAINVQFATEVGTGVIAGVSVGNKADCGLALPLEEQVAQRAGGIHPHKYLIDGGFAQRDSITVLTKRRVTVYAPVRPPRTETSGRDASSPRTDDSPEVIAWRERMKTEDAKEMYKKRASTAEWANAQTRKHGLLSFTVRGLEKTLSVALLVATTHNILRALVLTAV
jgi:transposase